MLGIPQTDRVRLGFVANMAQGIVCTQRNSNLRFDWNNSRSLLQLLTENLAMNIIYANKHFLKFNFSMHALFVRSNATPINSLLLLVDACQHMIQPR